MSVEVIVVEFGDWNENSVEMGNWVSWNEYYICRNIMDKICEGYEWDRKCGSKEELDFNKLYNFSVNSNKFFMNVKNEYYNEEGVMVFNVEEFLKLNGKVVSGNGEVVEDMWSKEEWKSISMMGSYGEDVKYMILCDDKLEKFKICEVKDLEDIEEDMEE